MKTILAKLWVMATLLLCVLFAACGKVSATSENNIDDGNSEEENEIKILSFSKEPGVYDSEFVLQITSTEPLKIYYTTDGSNPCDSASRIEYSDGITLGDRSQDANVVSAVSTALYDAANVSVLTTKDGFKTNSSNPSSKDVDKCNVIRAVGVKDSGEYTDVLTGTYFYKDMESHIPGVIESVAASRAAGLSDTLAIISITGNYDDFFDYETGIYVKGKKYDDAIKKELLSGAKLTEDTSRRIDANYNQKGREWERPVHIDFFETDGQNTNLVLSEDCGIRIQGNYSRSDLQKGFRLYARKSYGSKNFKYPIFGNDLKDDSGQTIDKFKTLILRNGGNCAFTTKFSADYWAYMSAGMKVDTLASRPVIVYLNGEYWGLYVLEEDFSQDYFADTHNVTKENVVLYKGDAEKYALGYKLDLGSLPENVTDEAYYFTELNEFFATHDSLAGDKDYEAFCKLVDPESLLNYFAVEVFINNKWDWPGKNWSMWRTTSVDEGNPYGDMRWRFCFYDLEFGGVSGSGDANVNTVKEDNYKPKGLLDFNTTNPTVLCFAYCMTNENFRNDFYDKLRELSTESFEKENAKKTLTGFTDTYSPLYEQFFNRYPRTGNAKIAVQGGYASAKCISDFLDNRDKYIETIISWCEKNHN